MRQSRTADRTIVIWNAMQRVFVLIVICFVLIGRVIPVAAQDRGNTTAQEYGDPIYRQLDPSASFGYDYNHTAVFAGLDSDHNGKVLQALGKDMVTQEAFFYDQFTSYGIHYYGAYTLNNHTMTFSDRKSVVSTAISLVNAAIPYPSTFPLIPVCIVYYGSTFDGTIADISNIRCDGFVEYAYEKNNFRVWRNQDYVDGTWSIVLYPDLNNDRPDITRNPEDEASPWAQRGAPCATGPNTEFGCSYFAPDTKMTSPAIIQLPSYQVTTNGGPGYLDVIVQATDESGSSGLPISFSLISGPVSLNGNVVTLAGTGSVTIRASQSGNSSYNPAPSADQSFTVYSPPNLKVDQTGNSLTFTWPTNVSGYTLECTTNLAVPIIWSPVAQSSIIVDSNYTLTINTNGGTLFYHLKK